MAKLITFNEEAREGFKRDVDMPADAVKVAFGPKGRNVVLDKTFGGPLVTNDGVTIVCGIDVEDPFKSLSAQLIKSAAVRTNGVAGDGTTTATLLAQALIHEGLRNTAAGVNPVSLNRGIRAASDKAVELLRQCATLVNSSAAIAQVTTIPSRDTEIGDLVVGAMDKVGKDSIVSVEESQSIATELSVTESVSFSKGFLSPYFITDVEAQQAILDGAQVLLVHEKISSLPEFLPIPEKTAESGEPTLIMVEDIEGEALSALVINAMCKTLKVAAVKIPYFGDHRKVFMDDLAVVTGVIVVTADTGIQLKDVGLEVLGNARRITITRDKTVLVDGTGTAGAVKERRNQIRVEIEHTDSDWDREELGKHPAKLSGGVAVIKVGTATETEVNKCKLRAEGTINAARAAAQEGVIAGGGSVLVQISHELEVFSDEFEGDGAAGVRAAAKALTHPAFWATENVGKDGTVAVYHTGELENGNGYNAATDIYESLIESGVIDPVKVTHSVTVNATSVACMLLTAEASAVDKSEEEPQYDHTH